MLEQAIVVRATDDTIVGWTLGAVRLSGYDESEVLGRSLHTLLHGAASASSGARVTLLRKDGARTEVQWMQTPVCDHRGHLIAFTDVLVPVGAASAVTEPRRLSEPPEAPARGDQACAQSEALKRPSRAPPPIQSTEEPFRHVLESLPMLCWIVTAEGTNEFTTSRWCEYAGLPPERLRGDGWHVVVHPDDLATAREALRRPPSGKPCEPLAEVRIRRHDGEYRWFELHASAEYDPQGRLCRWIGASLDVHERYLVRAALQAEREHLARIVAAAPGAFFSCRQAPDGTLSMPHASEALQEMVGATPAEINAAIPTLEHVHPDDRARVRESIDASGGGLHRWQKDFRILSAAGGTIWVQGSAIPVREPDGGVQWFGFLQDITARKRSEETQLRTQKLEALGTLAGGIAHDFNNMLHAIAGNCALAQRQLPAGHPARALLDAASVAGERAADLVRRLLQFSRPTHGHRDVLPLRRIVREALRLVRATIPARIEIHEELGDDDPFVEADATQIHRVMLNLAGNAAHAIGESSGSLRVRLERTKLDAADPRLVSGAISGEVAALHVTDSGSGMDESVAARIFDPFFTTKEVGEGAGLGLSMVHAIMTSLGGDIAVRTTPREGTTFTLYFPICPAPPLRVAPAPPPVDEGPLGGRVLLVDDEPILVELGAHTLEMLGYEVRAFTRPREALRAFFDDPDGIDVVLTDLAMPDLSGFDLAKRLLELRPTLPIVMMSGNVGEEELAKAQRMGLHEVLLKPVSIETLGHAVRAALLAGRVRTHAS